MESPAAAAAAGAQAEEALQADAAEDVLALCLQQPAFCQPDGRAAITLMCVSKQLRALVTRCCHGTLALPAVRVDTAAQAQSLAAWMSHHGDLLHALKLEIIRAFQWQTAAQEAQRHPAACIMDSVPGNLQRLSIGTWVDLTSTNQELDASISAVKAAAAALAGVLSQRPMQQLRCLVLPGEWMSQATVLLPALAALSQLTSLVMWSGHEACQLPVHHLPPQLQQLELTCYTSTSGLPWLALPHLTALTSMNLGKIGACVDGGELPRGLRALTVTDISSNTAPLQQLAQLAALQLTDCSASAEQLRQLSTLQRLQQLSMRASSLNGAAAFGVLPLTRLRVSGFYPGVTTACLDHLGACARLTCLKLHDFWLAPDANLKQLAVAVSCMTALECLRLVVWDRKQPQGGDAWTHVWQALARLPRLTACDVSSAQLSPVAAVALARATQLTGLLLWQCGLDDAAVTVIIRGLTGLQCLDVSWNEGISGDCLAALAGLAHVKAEQHAPDADESERDVFDMFWPDMGRLQM